MDRKDRRKIIWSKYIAVFIASGLIFILGVSIGQQLSERKISAVGALVEDLRTQIAGAELHYILASKNPCEQSGINELAKELDTLSALIQACFLDL